METSEPPLSGGKIGSSSSLTTWKTHRLIIAALLAARQAETAVEVVSLCCTRRFCRLSIAPITPALWSMRQAYPYLAVSLEVATIEHGEEQSDERDYQHDTREYHVRYEDRIINPRAEILTVLLRQNLQSKEKKNITSMPFKKQQCISTTDS